MDNTYTKAAIKKLIPALSARDKSNIRSYYRVYEKYHDEISVKALEDLKQHPVFGELIRSTPKDVMDAQSQLSRKLQRDAIVNENWEPYIDHQVAQGHVYAKMGFDFKSWYEIVALVKVYLTPYLIKEYGKGEKFLAALDGMNRFIDMGMAIIGEAYLDEKQHRILEEREELQKTLQEVTDYKYALDESAIVAITDQKGIITHVNDNFCKISKYSREELIGQDHRIINSGYHPKPFIKGIWTTIAKGKVWKGELKNKAKDGTIYWVDTTIVPFLNDQGKPFQYVAIRSDITERKKAKEKIIHLNESLEQKVQERTAQLQQSLDTITNFQSLFETVPGLYLVLLPDFTISAVSDEYLQATMLKREAILGKHLFDVFPDNPDDPNADGVSNLRKSLEIVLKTKQAHEMPLQKYDIRKPDGTFEERYWSPLNKPVLNANNEVIYLTHRVQDVTQRLMDEREIVRISNENSDLYNNAPCGYIAIDAGLEVSNINLTLLNWLGYSANEVVGKMKFEDLLSPESREIHRKNLPINYQEFISKGFVNDREYDFQRKDKTTFPAAINATAMFNENGDFVKSRTVVFDNTYRKKSEHRLKEANAELEAQAQKLQASEEELRAQQEELMQANIEMEEKSLLLEEKNQTVLEKNDELTIASQELHLKAQELALSNKYKSEFLANMSHELRTPLNSILLLSKLLSDNAIKNLTDEQVEFATIINNSGNGLLELINEILDLSKIESGNMSLDIEEVGVLSLCKTTLDMFSPLAQEKGIEFNITSEQNVPRTIKTDRVRVEQVIKNFMSNAIKFTEQGSVSMHVRLPHDSEIKSLKHNPDQLLVFEVKDTGIGIPEDKHSLIFEAFKQADGSTRRKYGGTGLGLSISRKISQMLGGDVLLQSKPGQGSSFSLIIPSDGTKVDYSKAGVSEMHIARKEKKQESTILIPEDYSDYEIADDRQTITPSDKIILIAESEKPLVSSFTDLLHQKGYKVIVATSGAHVKDFVHKYKPEGILLDLKLPHKSGLDVLKELKSDPVIRHIPVCMMSADQLNTNGHIDLGAIDFIQKPVIAGMLDQMLDRIAYLRGTSPKTVLLVDDNEIHVNAIKDFITSPGIKCLTARTREEAIDLLLNTAIDCLVLEMELPDDSGYEILDVLKKNQALKSLPVVIYTGKSLSHHEEKKIRQLTGELIVKTSDTFKDLAEKISSFLHVATPQDEDGRLKKPYLHENALGGKHVLIVDDDVRNIFSLTKLLESKKMNVSSAIDGNEALSVLKNDPTIDLVLMDMMMPNKDGYETISEIREHNTLKKTKIIAVTAKAMVGDREKCIRAGANDYITKPVDTDQLVSLLKVWLYK